MAYLLLQSGGRLLLQSSGALLLEGADEAVAGRPGGTFRRRRDTWGRVFGRTTWRRVFGRAAAADWSRTWEYSVVRIDPQTRTVFVQDDRDFLFDYSTAPELVAGDTIETAVLVGGDGLTKGAAAKTAAKLDGIEAGQAVQARISGWAAGNVYTLACVATLNTGRTLTIPARLACSAAY